MDNQNHTELFSQGLQTIPEVAAFLGISRSLVYRLINGGDLPTVRLGRSRRVPHQAVINFAAANLVCGESPPK